MRIGTIIGASFAVASALPAQAATIVVNHVFDPAHVNLSFTDAEALANPFTMEVGDTLDITMTFIGGQAVTLTNAPDLWLLALTDQSATLQTQGTLEFLGASANVVAGPIPLSQDNRFVHVGNYYTSNLFATDANPISFTGLRQVITITGDDLGAPRTYSKVDLYTAGTVGVGGTVPEPATWAMLILGLGLVGATLRKRRVRVRYAFA